MVNSFDLLISGEIIQSIISIYTNIIGGWFYLLIGLGLIVAVYIKTDSIEVTAILMFVMGLMGGFAGYLRQSQETANINLGLIWILIMVTGLGMIIYKIYSTRHQ